MKSKAMAVELLTMALILSGCAVQNQTSSVEQSTSTTASNDSATDSSSDSTTEVYQKAAQELLNFPVYDKSNNRMTKLSQFIDDKHSSPSVDDVSVDDFTNDLYICTVADDVYTYKVLLSKDYSTVTADDTDTSQLFMSQFGNTEVSRAEQQKLAADSQNHTQTTSQGNGSSDANGGTTSPAVQSTPISLTLTNRTFIDYNPYFQPNCKFWVEATVTNNTFTPVFVNPTMLFVVANGKQYDISRDTFGNAISANNTVFPSMQLQPKTSTTGWVYFALDKADSYTVELIDASGRVLASTAISFSQAKQNVSNNW